MRSNIMNAMQYNYKLSRTLPLWYHFHYISWSIENGNIKTIHACAHKELSLIRFWPLHASKTICNLSSNNLFRTAHRSKVK